jgi:redox-sensitive bicupin YhaK (pirin superfamily)
MSATAPYRTLRQRIVAQPASDGAGVRMLRFFDARAGHLTDPFLMLDLFGTENPDDYIAGFPPHPHRGFETVTYMIDGRMRHEDSRGNQGDLEPGGVQWMTAGRGIVHSEMPQQQEGAMRGFQLWINLPAAMKMVEPGYQDIQPDQIPEVALDHGGRVRVVAGEFGGVRGPVKPRPTRPLFLDVHLPAGVAFEIELPAGHRAFLAPHQGGVNIDGEVIETGTLALLQDDGERIRFRAGAEGCRCLLVAASPIGEPIAHYGPFVMNTQAEIMDAIRDYQAGRF